MTSGLGLEQDREESGQLACQVGRLSCSHVRRDCTMKSQMAEAVKLKRFVEEAPRQQAFVTHR